MSNALVTLLQSSGELSAACAKNLQANGYSIRPDGIAPDDRHAMGLLSDALVSDKTGHSTLNDRDLLHNNWATNDWKHAARSRMTLRAECSCALLLLSDEMRRVVVDLLAVGDGKTAAEALEKAALSYADANLAALNADASFASSAS